MRVVIERGQYGLRDYAAMFYDGPGEHLLAVSAPSQRRTTLEISLLLIDACIVGDRFLPTTMAASHL